MNVRTEKQTNEWAREFATFEAKLWKVIYTCVLTCTIEPSIMPSFGCLGYLFCYFSIRVSHNYSVKRNMSENKTIDKRISTIFVLRLTALYNHVELFLLRLNSQGL